MAAMPTGPQWWVSGRKGTLSPWAQAQVFALCKISEKKGVFLYDSDIAQEVFKVGGGHPPGRPSESSGRSSRQTLTGTQARCLMMLGSQGGQK